MWTLLLACAPLDSLSPSRKSLQTSPWVSLVLNMPDRFRGATVTTELDGVDQTDPLGFVRRRVTSKGGGYDYLATLDLFELSAGDHTLLYRVQKDGGGSRKLKVPFSYVPEPCEVSVLAMDPDSNPLPVRMLVLDSVGNVVDLAGPDAAASDPSDRDIQLRGIATDRDGYGGLTLPVGSYELVAFRGIRDSIDRVPVDCSEGGRVDLTVSIERLLPLHGWLTADLHVHTGRSADSFLPDRLRIRSIDAAAIDVPVYTDHNTITDPAETLGYGLGGVESRIGVEDPDDPGDEDSLGHLNAFPLSADVELPDTLTEEPADLVERFLTLRGAEDGVESPAVQLNHVRGIQFFPDDDPKSGAHSLFNNLGARPDLPLDDQANDRLMAESPGGYVVIDADAFEVVNRFGWDLTMQTRQDWLGLLGNGVRITGTANSDSHSYEVEQVGFPVNLLQCESDAAACVAEAVIEGRVVGSSGPVVGLDVEGAGPGESVAAGSFTATVRVEAVPWVPVDEARLIHNGVVLATWELIDVPRQEDGTLSWEAEVSIDADGPGYLVAEAGWPVGESEPPEKEPFFGIYALIAPGQVPHGFTNPVWIE